MWEIMLPNIRLCIDVEVQKVGFLVRTRSVESQLAEATTHESHVEIWQGFPDRRI
jgi:hypothetical protein